MPRISSIPSVERSDSRSRISSDWDRAIVHSSWLNWLFTKEGYAVAHLLFRERNSPVEVRPGQTPAHSQPLIPNTTTRDTILILGDTGFVKKGITSAGVQRQYSGTAGRTENCQIGVFAAYATTRGRALVDRELYLPKSWTDDRQRCRAAKIPDERTFATKGELARAIVLRALASPLPIAWVTADSAYGQEWRFRRMLEEVSVGYVLAVPKSQHVPRFGRIDHLFTQAPDEAWEKRSCGDGAKGPRVYHWAAVQLPAIEDFDGETPTHQRWALARRSVTRPDEIAYYLGYAPVGTDVDQLVRVAGRRWAIEECFQAAKNECGLDQYEVRRYVGWMRHITLAMLAHAFLATTAAQAASKGGAETGIFELERCVVPGGLTGCHTA
ncbi:IS701 family transposase [Streptomyces sp. NPDC048279]|uniref:IS701 family transposase n=1 Tax=Streptomyces sp. NPDC048279 TaxID=3154714 RepID=UPI003439FC9C